MKLISIMAFILLFLQVGIAQEETQKNNFVIGGSMNFLIQNNTYPLSSLPRISGIGGIYSGSTIESKNTRFSIAPFIGKELNDKVLVGILIDYSIAKYESLDVLRFGSLNPIDFERSSTQFGIGLFARYVFNPADRFNFFVQPRFEYNTLKSEEFVDLVTESEEVASYIELGIGMGMLYDINERFRTTLRVGGLNYVNGSWEIVGTETNKKFNSLGMNINFSSVYFGFEMIL